MSAQKSLGHDVKDEEFKKAYELFQNKKYGSARIAFSKYIQKHGAQPSVNLSEAAYYEARCATQLENEDILYKWESFLRDYPESKRLHFAYYHLGDYYQENSKFRQATRWFEKVEPSGLDKTTRNDYYFKGGYAHFMEGNYDQALSMLNEVRDTENKYYHSVLYYYSHIQYEKGNYETALKGFKELEEVNAFKKVVPFYIAQIYYLQEDYKTAIDYALPLAEEGTSARQADIARIVADSYFALKEYKNAISYYDKTIRLSSSPKREDYYHLGFASYFVNDYEKATVNLSRVTSNEDQLSQNAYYHLGDCYLRLKDKKRARVAFEAASKYAFDKDIQEDALFNYIKLNYELAYSPFNEIINSFLSYIELFPESDKIDQAYDYLGNAFLTTKNYREALSAMEKIKRKSATVYQAMQRVSFYRGLELFTDLSFTEAIEFFDYSLKYGEYNKSLKLRALYWRGEARYRLADFELAKSDFKNFIHTPGSYSMDEFSTAHYNIGYASFKQKMYDDAQAWFRKYVNLSAADNSTMRGDAYNRLGDCFYVVREFETAIAYYDKALAIPEASPDYALFQKAFCLGLQQKYQQKINVLSTLVNRYPNSSYIDDAYYEMGRSYVALDDLQQAIRNYKTVKEKYPRGSYAKKAMLQLGLVYYNNGDLSNSLAFYKRVVNEFPGTPEAEDALLGARNVYMDQNDLDGYMRYASQLGSYAKVDEREQDSLTFVTAERFYMKGDCEHAVRHFQSYIQSFPQGLFILNAHFYKADCQYRNNNLQEALSSYEYVAGRERSLFTEEALIHAGSINFRNNQFEKALVHFQRLEAEGELMENRLEAKIGQMRCLSKMAEYEACLMAAEKVLLAPKLGDEIKREAIFNKGKCYQALNDDDSALGAFNQVARNTKSEEGAQAKYLVAQIYYNKSQPEKSETVIFDYIEKGTPHQYWLARAFILLADIYHDRGENFQAMQYLESIKANYQGDDDVFDQVDERLLKWQVEDAKPDSIQ
jgi:TolA-binding protein